MIVPLPKKNFSKNSEKNILKLLKMGERVKKNLRIP